jgi:hypothetical protein
MTTRQRVRAINAHIRYSNEPAYLRPAGIRIHRASGDHGELCVQSLNTGKWITTTAADTIELTHSFDVPGGARP